MGKNGVYQVEIWYNGFKETKTFFPAHWSRKKVMNTVYEAYDNFIASGAQGVFDKGKYIIKGVSSEGIIIEMYITTSGKVTAAYPLL